MPKQKKKPVSIYQGTPFGKGPSRNKFHPKIKDTTKKL